MRLPSAVRHDGRLGGDTLIVGVREGADGRDFWGENTQQIQGKIQYQNQYLSSAPRMARIYLIQKR